jgi:hypothetical protein
MDAAADDGRQPQSGLRGEGLGFLVLTVIAAAAFCKCSINATETRTGVAIVSILFTTPYLGHIFRAPSYSNFFVGMFGGS